ncbi:hypothetical protein T552_00246 [Pneumocystis carinii B80]|uniref:Uncharacterized protein n=1 Tax=Pneumocystis carinii (strain B80) TaxID=1408658 RepID=A0A0W4ZTB2_PNEC8|nr:hypothetical protein T552_00246 [Pneumocystis carinii B80]KTW31608.1 hypothetical protein T552_00246 [Pneumocystis carinii B80]
MNKKRNFNDLLICNRLKKKYKDNRPSLEEIYTSTLAKLYSAQNTPNNHLIKDKKSDIQSLQCDDCDQVIIFASDTLPNFDDYSCISCHHIVCDICRISKR